DRILALDSDFLGLDVDQIHHSRGFMTKRKAEAMSRLYVVESNYTITGTMADHRLRMPSSHVGSFLLAVAKELGVKSLPDMAPVADEKWIKAVAKDMREYGNRSVVIVGHRQPAWVHALGHAVNATLGNIASGVVEFRDPPPEAKDKTIADLVKD